MITLDERLCPFCNAEIEETARPYGMSDVHKL